MSVAINDLNNASAVAPAAPGVETDYLSVKDSDGVQSLNAETARSVTQSIR